MKNGIIISMFFLTACGTKKQEYKPDDKLIDFQSYTVMSMDSIIESGEENYKRIYSENFNPKTDTIRYEKDLIYISYLSIVNGCAEYGGDIEIKNDSLLLNLRDIGEISCTEQRCDRLIFKIKNLEDKKYKIKKW
jgi:hypothetical protein